MHFVKTLIALFLLLASHRALSQNPGLAAVDSLKEIFSQRGEPKDRIKVSYTIARLLYPTDPQQSLVWSDTTIFLAEKHSVTDVLPKIYSIKAKAYDRQAKYEEALHFFSISADLAEEQRDTFQWASSLLSKGAILSYVGEKKVAIPLLTKAYDLLDGKTDTASMENKVGVVINLGNTLRETRNFKKAIDVYQEGIDLAKKLDLTLYKAYLYNNLSLVYAEVNDFPAQRKMLWEANNILSEDDPNKYPILMSIASTYKYEEKPDSAIQFYRKAYGLVGADSLTLISLCNGLSESYLLDKNYPEAKKWAEAALKFATRFKVKKEMARAYTNNGRCLSHEGRRAEAEHFFQLGWQVLPHDEPGMERLRLELLEAKLKNRFQGDDLAVYEAFREVFDTVFNQQKTNAIENARIEFETQLAEDSLKILAQTNQIQELQLKKQEQRTLLQWLVIALFATLAAGLYFFLAKRKRENEELNQLNFILKRDNNELFEKIGRLETDAVRPPSLGAFADELVVLNGNEKTVFKIADILFIQAQGNGLQVTTVDGKHWRWQRLRNVAEVLPNPPFIQAHRSYIVNGMHIRSMRAGKFQVSNGEEVPIGRVYQEKVEKFVEAWLPNLV